MVVINPEYQGGRDLVTRFTVQGGRDLETLTKRFGNQISRAQRFQWPGINLSQVFATWINAFISLQKLSKSTALYFEGTVEDTVPFKK